MSRLTFRNSRGELVYISTVAATKVKHEFGAILKTATQDGAVAITLNNSPKVVLLSYQEFESLVKTRARALDNLGAEFGDRLARMQTPKARHAMEAAFNAPPAKLGRAAGKTPKPKLVLHLERERISNPRSLKRTPDWAKPIVTAALKLNLR
jgi:prevent-host-death family protein